MQNFAAHLEEVERTLRRSLTADELRLVKLWDLTAKNDSPGPYRDEFTPPPQEQSQVEEYEGRFKIAFSKGQYEVYFVCATLMLRPVIIPNKEDVLLFLTQEPICLHELMVQQAIAAADQLRPAQINQNIILPEPMLRSMGFVHR